MRIVTPCIIAAAVSQLGVTDCGTITRDPGFDLWCGDALCAWKLERGDIRRAATWHAEDAGVELVDPDTAIEQFTPVDHRDGTCIRFDLITDVDENAQVELGIDIYGDGTIERTYPVPTAHWKPVSYEFSLARPFTGMRFEIAKRGPGHAVVARMRAQVVDDGECAGLPVIAGGPAPLGALCTAHGDCETRICAAIDAATGNERCAACDPAASACGAGLVCGLADPGVPERAVPIECVPAGARVLGEQCLKNAECQAGLLCTFGVCSTCWALSPCGSACKPSYELGPFLCSPGMGLGKRGDPCASPGDCMSGACGGPARRQCADGRACATDANCPVESNLVPGPCTTVGVQGGRCN